MIRSGILIGLLMMVLIASAQPKLSNDFKISVSTPFQVVDAQNKLYFSDNMSYSYSIKTNEENVIIQKFDVKSMKEVGRNEYKDTPPYNRAINVVQLGEKFYYLFESINKKEDTKSVYVREVLTADCSLGKQSLLFTSDGDVANGAKSESIGYWGVKSGAPFSVHKSFDNSKIMINYRRKPVIKSDAVNHDLLGFFVYNASMELIWGREVKMPFTEKEINNLAYTVSTDGTVYMMAFHREQQNFQLITIPASGELTTKVIESEDFMFNNLYMKENKDGNIGFLGYYANGLDYKFWEGKLSFNTNGIRYFELSKEGKVLKSKNIEFPLELINQYVSKRQQNKNNNREEDGNAGIRDVVLRQFTVNPDGSVFILGEQYYYLTKRDAQTFRTSYSFYYQDLVATKLNADGEVQWMKKLPKRQFGTTGKGGMGISYLEGNGAHYILFLDNVKNANIDSDDVPDTHVDGKGGYLTAYKVDDATGNFSKHTLYNSLEVNKVRTYQFQTSRILEALDDVLLVEVYAKGKKDMMIKMELVQ